MSDMTNTPRPPAALAAATVQDLQMELIRRSQFNAFDGQRIVADLLAQRTDWEAVIFDTHALCDEGRMCGLIKLRDMARNLYNVDTLYVLARNRAAAHRLATWADPWRADSVEVISDVMTDMHLGGCDAGLHLVVMWWD